MIRAHIGELAIGVVLVVGEFRFELVNPLGLLFDGFLKVFAALILIVIVREWTSSSRTLKVVKQPEQYACG